MKALVYTGSDSMKAYGDVKIISVQNKDELYTEKIILYNIYILYTKTSKNQVRR